MDVNARLKCCSMALSIALLAVSPLAGATRIYKWYDATGQINYTQTPPPKTAIRIEKPGGHISVLKPDWSPGMKRFAREFMNDAGVRRVWINRNGKRVPGWY